MKKHLFKMIALAAVVSITFSSCEVAYRQDHHRYHDGDRRQDDRDHDHYDHDRYNRGQYDHNDHYRDNNNNY